MQSDIDIIFRNPFIFMFRSNISDRTQHFRNKLRITTYRENMVIDVKKLFNIDVFFQILINFFENLFIFMFGSKIANWRQRFRNKLRIATYRENPVIAVRKLCSIGTLFQVLMEILTYFWKFGTFLKIWYIYEIFRDYLFMVFVRTGSPL